MKASSPLFLAAAVGITLYGFAVGPANGFLAPDLARIVFWHVPSAFVASWFMIWSAVSAVQWLRTRDRLWDERLAASIELGALFAILTLLTGSLFSRVQWNAWWHWDPRQTSFLLVSLMLLGMWGLRGAFADEIKRANASAAYALGMVMPGLFLTFVFPRLPSIRDMSLHPSTTIVRNEFDLAYKLGFYGTLAALAVLVFQVYRLRVAVGHQELLIREQEEHGPDQADRGDSSDYGSVRPVALPKKG
ncbi:MAG: cytochrome c biogenesis protein CcsA [Fimbriimonadaceae bacterium]|nr:cytochrome c biogenesis protein CcsA [Fimbriimonadaceae bacterium]